MIIKTKNIEIHFDPSNGETVEDVERLLNVALSLNPVSKKNVTQKTKSKPKYSDYNKYNRNYWSARNKSSSEKIAQVDCELVAPILFLTEHIGDEDNLGNIQSAKQFLKSFSKDDIKSCLSWLIYSNNVSFDLSSVRNYLEENLNIDLKHLPSVNVDSLPIIEWYKENYPGKDVPRDVIISSRDPASLILNLIATVLPVDYGGGYSNMDEKIILTQSFIEQEISEEIIDNTINYWNG